MSTKRKIQRVLRSIAESLQSPNLVMRTVLLDVTTSGSPSRAVIATENPIPRWDEQSNQVVSEVLLMDGIVLRGGRDWIPIVDSHNDRTVRNIFGSIRGLKIDANAGELYGEPVFASDAESQTIAVRMNEGHITDFSITAQPLETTFVKRGDSYTTARGVVIDGPALIHTQWQPLNASICATGADEDSTVRRSYTDLKRKVIRMDEALLSQLSAMGLPDGMTDPNQVLSWVVGKLSGSEAEESSESEVPAEPVMNMDPSSDPMIDPKKDEMSRPLVENMAGEDAKPDEVQRQSTVDTIRRLVLDADAKRRQEIIAACTLAKVERAFADELCDGHVPLSEARKRIIERMANQPLGASVGADVRVTQDGTERMHNAMRDALVVRSHRSARFKTESESAKNKDHSDFVHLSLNRMAEMVLRSYGINTDRMNSVDVAKVAMGNPNACRRYRVERDAFHTSGSFPNILLDAINKTLLQAYEEAPYSWTIWARQAPSVADFKTIHRTRFSEAPDPEMVPERHEYKEKELSDSRESYTVNKYGEKFTVSWETVVNDDLDAISRIPAMHGNACRRKVNKEVYSVLTSNPTMGDGVALFGSHSSGSNLSGSSGSPSVANLNSAYAAMRTQKGLSSDTIVNINPAFLIVPAALAATALELVNSTSYIVANGNQGVQNIYGKGGSRSLNVIEEPILDASSTTAWYLAADNAQQDTVEVSFLQGEESPVLEDRWDFDRDVYEYKVRQTFGVKAIDWRGLYKFAVS